MRIKSIYIEAFRNLKKFKIEFTPQGTSADGDAITFNSYAIIGQNGSGKSNLIEAIITIFRDLDLKNKPDFSYNLEYEVRGHTVIIEALAAETPLVIIDGKSSSVTAISKEENGFLPRNVFAYYSGKNDRIESLFHRHQKRFYDDLLNNESIPLRRLFLCRNVHSQFVLLAYLIDDDEQVKKILSFLGIQELESVLFTLKRPYWYGRNSSDTIIQNGDNRFWYARGKVKDFLSKLWEFAVAPIDYEESRAIDFRDRKEKFELLYLFLKDEKALKGLVQSFPNESTTESTPITFFKYLESTYISDLIDEVKIKVKHKYTDEDVSFRELSEGEQQLLTVLGLMRLTKEEETLFLLDEPDTHLNPVWKLHYFDDIKNVIEDSSSQILITTHDPLIVGSLKKEQVRILRKKDGYILAEEPFEDPQGMGVSGLLKSDLFGLSSTVDSETTNRIKHRNELFAKKQQLKKLGKDLSPSENEMLTRLSEELSGLGFAMDFKDPFYSKFIEKMALHTKFHKSQLTSEEQKERDEIADEIIDEILKESAQ